MAAGRTRRRGSGRRPIPKGMGPQQAPQTDHFAALNAWDDPNISGPEAQISQGYGGFSALDTMQGTKINNYLNQFSVGGDRERAMNALGYNNYGNPFTPKVAKGYNQQMRGRAQGNAKTGGYSAPGIYQHSTFYDSNPGGATADANQNFGGYTGFTTVDQGGAAKYTPFDINRRPQQGMPHTQIGQNGKGTGAPKRKAGSLPGQPGGLGGRPVVGKPGPGGGAKKGGIPSFKPGGFPKPTVGAQGGVGAFPKMPPTPPNFLPMTPGYESAYRGANDALSAAEGQYAVGQSMIPAQLGLAETRLRTDQDVETDRLKEMLAERGVYTPYSAASTAQNPRRSASPAGGGVGEALYNRHIATPFGRSYQDLASQGAGQYADLAQGYGGAQLGFNQSMYEALLGRAADAYEAMPLNLPIGGYDLPGLPGPMFSTGGSTKPAKKGPGKKPGRNRPRKKR